jgi:hypothetical protein
MVFSESLGLCSAGKISVILNVLGEVMGDWSRINVKAAPMGMICLIQIGLTAVCFPLLSLLGSRARPISVAVILVSGVLFAPAITCSVYSIVIEKAKIFGLAGLLLAGITIVAERETLYFLEMGLGTVPLTLLFMMVLAKWRNRKKQLHIRIETE